MKRIIAVLLICVLLAGCHNSESVIVHDDAVVRVARESGVLSVLDKTDESVVKRVCKGSTPAQRTPIQTENLTIYCAGSGVVVVTGEQYRYFSVR